MIFLRDEEFIRGDIPMTKEDVRMCAGLLLQPKTDSYILDIGGGTGAMAVQLAKWAEKGTVWTVEKKKEACELLESNKRKFGAENLCIIEGEAPKDLPRDVFFDRVFIGGSTGQLEGIFEYLETHLKPGGQVVMNFILLEAMEEGKGLLGKNGYEEIVIKHILVQKAEKLGKGMFLKAQNGIFVIGGKKSE